MDNKPSYLNFQHIVQIIHCQFSFSIKTLALILNLFPKSFPLLCKKIIQKNYTRTENGQRLKGMEENIWLTPSHMSTLVPYRECYKKLDQILVMPQSILSPCLSCPLRSSPGSASELAGPADSQWTGASLQASF